ncbi:lasso peptide biosynthesis PqqD family chaperone [Streptomyces iconiensis]|uniref:Lasso peptide biosynthesis PqqD family chaperone n=1 Tax=Streptomyces iconiensis TaxID=1384038 RepID=A0ABT7A1Q5_9ACTN|nr:lasso peptide biosynthesis PqqD family chaperone [Streptomyces iconiensis]MDJ1135246.1 lasso peptide biosynthesis PqqD family chaperone [Streptomyces iconiensis]
MTLALTRDVSLADVEDGAVLLDERRGRYFKLNATGRATLALLLEGHSPEEAAAKLTERHPAAAERALADVHVLMRGLLDAKLAVRS